MAGLDNTFPELNSARNFEGWQAGSNTFERLDIAPNSLLIGMKNKIYPEIGQDGIWPGI